MYEFLNRSENLDREETWDLGCTALEEPFHGSGRLAFICQYESSGGGVLDLQKLENLNG